MKNYIQYDDLEWNDDLDCNGAEPYSGPVPEQKVLSPDEKAIYQVVYDKITEILFAQSEFLDRETGNVLSGMKHPIFIAFRAQDLTEEEYEFAQEDNLVEEFDRNGLRVLLDILEALQKLNIIQPSLPYEAAIIDALFGAAVPLHLVLKATEEWLSIQSQSVRK